MDIAIKILDIIAWALVVVGAFWGLDGFIEYLKASKHGDKKQKTEASETIAYGAVLAIAAKVIVELIKAYLNNNSF